jgi:carbon monoxide dehydrogenase subunit G
MITRLELTADGDGTWVKVVASGKATPHWTTLGQQNLSSQLERLERTVSSRARI